MKQHLFCLTTDTDPDGLSGKSTNRRALTWDGLIQAETLPDDLRTLGDSLGCQMPMTWFVRADGQLRDRFGTSQYLLEHFRPFWNHVSGSGHEIGWHPHVYRNFHADVEPLLITDPVEACEELDRLWHDWGDALYTPTAFRHGEGWHCAQTFAMVETFGFLCDSTAIPGRCGGAGHPMNWLGTPNRPYFPDTRDIRQPNGPRALLEIPMNTWLVKAPYDAQPKVRYMNPAVHESIFTDALHGWKSQLHHEVKRLFVWVLIFHPDEIMSMSTPNALYAQSRTALCQNLRTMVDFVKAAGDRFEFVTISEAAKRWKQHEERGHDC